MQIGTGEIGTRHHGSVEIRAGERGIAQVGANKVASTDGLFGTDRRLAERQIPHCDEAQGTRSGQEPNLSDVGHSGGHVGGAKAYRFDQLRLGADAANIGPHALVVWNRCRRIDMV